MPNAGLIDSLPHLDDHDVSVLYDIVSIAAESPRRPIKSLFEAYQRVVPQNQPNADPSSKYFLFLSHAGSYLAKRGNAGIVRQFKALLAAAGIEIVLAEDKGQLYVESDVDEVIEDGRAAERGRPRRRASFNDTNLDSTWLSTERLLSTDRVGRRRQRSHQPDEFLRDSAQHGGGEKSQAGKSYPARVAYSQQPTDDAIAPSATRLHEMQSEAAAFAFETVMRKHFWSWLVRASQTRRRDLDLDGIAVAHDKRILLRQSFWQWKDSIGDLPFWQQQDRRASRARSLFLLTKAFTHWAQVASEAASRTNAARRHILCTRYFSAWRELTVVNEKKCRRPTLMRWFVHWRSLRAIRQNDIEAAAAYDRARIVERAYWKWFWFFCERQAPSMKDTRLQQSSLARLRQRLAISQSMCWEAQQKRAQMLQIAAVRRVKRAAAQFKLWNDTSVMHNDMRTKKLAFTALLRHAAFDPRETHFRRRASRTILSKSLQIWQTRTAMNKSAAAINHYRSLSGVWTTWNDSLRVKCLQRKRDDQTLLRSIYKWMLEERGVLFDRLSSHRLMSNVLECLRHQLTERVFQLEEATMILEHNQEERLLRSCMTQFHMRIRMDERSILSSAEFRNAHLLPKIIEALRSKSVKIAQMRRWAEQARFYCLTTSALRSWNSATIEAQRRRRREAFAVIRKHQKQSVLVKGLQDLTAVARRFASDNAAAQQFRQRAITAKIQACLRSLTLEFEQRRVRVVFADQMVLEYRLGDALSGLILRLSEISQMQVNCATFVNDRQARNASKMIRRLGDDAFVLQRQRDTAIAWRTRRFNMRQKEMLRAWASRAIDKRAARILSDPDSPSRTPMLRASRRPRARPLGADLPPIDQVFGASNASNTGDVSHAVNQSVPNLIDFTATPIPAYLRTPRRSAMSNARFRSTISDGIANIATPGTIDFGSSVVLESTTPAPLIPGSLPDMEALTPQITPFQRRLRAGGYRHSLNTPANPRSVGSRLLHDRLQEFGFSVRFADTDVTAQRTRTHTHNETHG